MGWYKVDEDHVKEVYQCDICIHVFHYRCKNCGLEQSKHKFCSRCHKLLEENKGIE